MYENLWPKRTELTAPSRFPRAQPTNNPSIIVRNESARALRNPEGKQVARGRTDPVEAAYQISTGPLGTWIAWV